MKKKVSLVLLCGVILLGVCGCGNDKKDLTGTYKINVLYGIEYRGTLKLFDSGNCTIKKEISKDGENNSTSEFNSCTYDVLDNTITFKYGVSADNMNKVSECIIEGKNLNCKDLGYIETRNNELWEKQ